MRHELLYGGTLTGGQTLNRVLGRGHVNGLLVFTDGDPAENRLTVKRRTASRSHILVPNVRLRDLRRITAIEHGYDMASASVLTAVHAILTAKAVCTDAEFKAETDQRFGSFNGLALVYVPLGSLYLGNESELDITITTDVAWATPKAVRVYAITHNRVPDVMLQTDYSLQVEQTHKSVDSIFLTSKIGPLNVGDVVRDITVQVQDDEASTMTDYIGLLAATSIFERVEGRVESQLLTVYRRRDAIPADVFLKVAGADADDVDIIVRRVLYDQAQVSANTLDELKKLQARVAHLETTAPDIAKALRHAGEITKAAQLAEVASDVAASNAADAK